MKKLWLVLLSLGLIMAFSVSAFAVDVKVSGEYFAGGLYLNKTQVFTNPDGRDSDTSTAFFYQRLRIGTDFIVSPCLKLVTRFDAMERIWGGQRSGYGGGDYYGYSYGGGTRAEGENISIDLVYIDYTAPIGQFKVGYQLDRVWGTVFDNWGEGATVGQIQYSKDVGPLTLLAQYAKEVDNSASAVYHGSFWEATDHDYDSYRVGAIYKFKGNNIAGETGALFSWDRDATGRPGNPAHLANIYSIKPYVKTKIGPVDLQAELAYYFGDAFKEEPPEDLTAFNVSVSALSFFVDASANFGMFNVGGSAAYISGDDPSTTDKMEGSGYLRGNFMAINTGGLDWNPCLILFNNDLRFWAGWIPGHTESYVDDIMYNAWFFQGRVGVKPTPQLDILLSVSYAMADKKPDTFDWGYTFANGTYGTEIDLVGNYKITNNLSYMLGFGYLFTGDLFKGYDDLPWEMSVQDNFILINKLTLTF